MVVTLKLFSSNSVKIIPILYCAAHTVKGQELRSGQKEPRLLSLIERSGVFM